MAIAFVQKTLGASGSTGITSLAPVFSSAQTAGNLIIVRVYGYDQNTDVSSIVDTKGNSYQVAVPRNVKSVSSPAALSWGRIYYAANIAAAAASANTVTVNFSAGTDFPGVAIYEFSGLATSLPLDQNTSAVGDTAGNPVTISSGSVTTTTANQLLFGGQVDYSTNATSGTGTGYTGLGADVNNQQDEYEIVSSTGAYAATFNVTGGTSPGNPWVAMIATFSTTSIGGGGGIVVPRPVMVRQAIARAAFW